jgi:hypothetical protein
MRLVKAYSVVMLLVCALVSLPATADSRKIKLKLTYNNRVVLGLISTNNASELDFILDGKNISVYYPDKGVIKFVGDRSTGHGYYFGDVNLRFHASSNTIDMYGIYKSHILHTHIQTDGKSSCSAAIETHLKPGFTSYEYDEPGWGHVNVKRTELSNIQCELSIV